MYNYYITYILIFLYINTLLTPSKISTDILRAVVIDLLHTKNRWFCFLCFSYPTIVNTPLMQIYTSFVDTLPLKLSNYTIWAVKKVHRRLILLYPRKNCKWIHKINLYLRFFIIFFYKPMKCIHLVWTSAKNNKSFWQVTT